MNKETNTGLIIKELRHQKGLTLEQLGDAVGVAKSTVKKWEDGSILNMRKDKLLNLAKALGVAPSELVGWTAPVKGANVYMIEKEEFPLYTAQGGETVERYIKAGDKDGLDFCVESLDDSMVDAGIHKGDMVFITKTDAVPEGQIAAVLVNDEVILRRFFFDTESGAVQLVPASSNFMPKIYTTEAYKELRVLGMAVSVQHHLI